MELDHVVLPRINIERNILRPRVHGFERGQRPEIVLGVRVEVFSRSLLQRGQPRLGHADLDVDVAFQWLKFFLEDDDELASIEAQYGSGSGDYWNTAAVKKRLVVELQGLVKDHQAKRNVLTDADVASWMAVRELAPAL